MAINGQYSGKLVATPDNATRGSEGRLYLQFPKALAPLEGLVYKVVGNFKRDGVVTLVASAEGCTVTPKLQCWWKNGVRDHGIRENWMATIWVLKPELLVVELTFRAGDPVPALPPHQQVLF